MSYDYDRTKTAAGPLPWGSYIDDFMRDLITDMAGQWGRGQKPQKFGSGGYFLTLTAYTRSDLEVEVTISATWAKRGRVFVWVKTEDPMRGAQEVLKKDLGFDDDPGADVKRVHQYLGSM